MNQQCVVAEYKGVSVFTVPKGLDLNDKSKVKNYYVRWDILHIEFQNGETMEIETSDNAVPLEETIDYKHPDYTFIDDAEKYGVEDKEECDCDKHCECCGKELTEEDKEFNEKLRTQGYIGDPEHYVQDRIN